MMMFAASLMSRAVVSILTMLTLTAMFVIMIALPIMLVFAVEAMMPAVTNLFKKGQKLLLFIIGEAFK